MSTKSKLLALIEETFQEFKQLDSVLSTEIKAQKGTLEKWAARDDAIHCAVYTQRFADRLAWPRDHARETAGDYLKTNEEIWKSHQTESWEEALQMWENACKAVIRGLESLSEEEFTDPKTFTWLDGQSPQQYIAGMHIHGVSHKQYILIRNGLFDAAIASADRAFTRSEALDSSERGQSRNLYNKACCYALAGQKKEAIGFLRDAFKKSSDLTEWSKQDTDLDSLRDDPDYKNLIRAAPAVKNENG